MTLVKFNNQHHQDADVQIPDNQTVDVLEYEPVLHNNHSNS